MVTPEPYYADETACLKPACGQPAHTRGYCQPHYRHRLHTGRYGFRDATEAREHVAKLRDLGWTWQAIADAAGLSAWVAHKLHTGTTRRLRHESLTALLSVPLVPVESHRGVDATGTRRRVQALAWMGWPLREIATRVDYPEKTLRRELCRGSISTRLARRVASVYDELSVRHGPSRISASWARRLGYAPPLAWDDIDNPRERPKGVAA